MVKKKKLKAILKRKKATIRQVSKSPFKNETESPPKTTDQIFSTNELLQGKYCNVGLIKHTPREFIFDFILAVDNHNLLVSRIITNPAHAKALYEALGKNIEHYKKTYGNL